MKIIEKIITLPFFLVGKIIENLKYLVLLFMAYVGYAVLPRETQQRVEERVEHVTQPVAPAVEKARELGVRVGMLSPPSTFFQKKVLMLKATLLAALSNGNKFLIWFGEKVFNVLLPPILVALIILFLLWWLKIVSF